MTKNNGKDVELFLDLDSKETPLEEISNMPDNIDDIEVSKEETLDLLNALQTFDEQH